MARLLDLSSRDSVGELQGTLAIFFFAGLQAVVNPFDSWTRVLVIVLTERRSRPHRA